jgi:c(7)-type cytochrome triheme protein
MTRAQSLPVAVLALLAAAPALAEMPVLPEYPPPHRYGTVVLDNSSSKAGMAPAVFEHWRHRLLYTCRLCHVDVGFALEAGVTRISADTNRAKLHCGACHNGQTRHADEPIFAACSDDREKPRPERCARCHGPPDRAAYQAFARTKPRDRAELIDWEEAERRAFTKPVDFVEGVSLQANRLKIDRNFSISIRGTWLGDIAFSHEKHARWHGCEACHPEIFPNTARGAAAYKMKDIVAGQYCGACHNKVAFPVALCTRCHRSGVGGPGTR